MPEGYDPDLYRIRHSLAHIMAQAVIERFSEEGEVKLGIGPPIENGFYYDFDLPRSVTDEDLKWIEKRMKKIIKESHPFKVSKVDYQKAQSLFKDQPYKLELIEGIIQNQFNNNQEEASLSIYEQDAFVDLCRGPHVEHTGKINHGAFKLMSVAGAYWQGKSDRPMLQRIYGVAFKNKEELDKYLWQKEEAEKRDHRKIGKELELFHMDPSAPGMPYWLPKGLKVLNELIDYWRKEHEKRGYQEIATPLINEKSLWETSGHWDHYKENMFIVPVDEFTTYGLKPMNCPNAMVVFNLKTRSYKDLPLRFSDCDVLHRHEYSGSLHGLLRTQKFQQDDAHIFITEDQIEEEYQRIFDIADQFYSIFDLKYTFRLGTRPEGYIGNLETWDKAENTLKNILNKRVGDNYIIEEGDGAFYGPKIDILMEDAIGRQWQMGTIQLDFHLPKRFNCTYIDRDGKKKNPIVIHRVIYGSLERFMGILIEHTAGNLPVWLSPVQATIIPIAAAHIEYAREVAEVLREKGIRVEVNEDNGRLNAKIREAQLNKSPFMLIVGGKEVENKTVAVRYRSGEDYGAMSLKEFIDLIQKHIEEKRLV